MRYTPIRTLRRSDRSRQISTRTFKRAAEAVLESLFDDGIDELEKAGEDKKQTRPTCAAEHLDEG